MNNKTVYAKTEKGEEELRTRKTGLDLPLRRVLILVDGSSNVDKVIEKGQGLPDITSSLETLLNDGYIVTSSNGSGRDIKADLIRIAQQTLGKDAEKVIKKIQKSPDSSEALRATIEECKKLVKLVIDEKKAEELSKRCLEII